MKVSLISRSSDDLVESIAWVARVSNPGNRDKKETSERLVRYLMKHKHWSPFEMFHICLEIRTTRDIGRQILRHRSFAFQEFSQRYAAVDEPLEYREGRMQDTENRQNSIVSTDAQLGTYWKMWQQTVEEASMKAYTWALQAGIAKEQARAVLPEGMTPTTMLMAGTLRSWIHYIELRSGVETQREHREVALACAEAISPIFPMIEEFLPQCTDS